MTRRAVSLRALIAAALFLLQALGPALHIAWGHDHTACSHAGACHEGSADVAWTAQAGQPCPVCALIARAHSAQEEPLNAADRVHLALAPQRLPPEPDPQFLLLIPSGDARAPPR